MSYQVSESDRSVRVLRALARAPAGMRLVEILGELGEAGRRSKAATVVMLKAMRGTGRVHYTPAPAGEAQRLGGTYELTQAGRDWLAAGGFEVDVPPGDGPLIVTGAMQGERPIVLRTVAQAGQVRLQGVVSFVFDLGRAIATPAP